MLLQNKSVTLHPILSHNLLFVIIYSFSGRSSRPSIWLGGRLSFQYKILFFEDI